MTYENFSASHQRIPKCGDIIILKNKIAGVITRNGEKYNSEAVIITTGTFLNGLIHVGGASYPAGRMGERPAQGLTECLQKHGLKTGRLKTGTPPRLSKKSIN